MYRLYFLAMIFSLVCLVKSVQADVVSVTASSGHKETHQKERADQEESEPASASTSILLPSDSPISASTSASSQISFSLPQTAKIVAEPIVAGLNSIGRLKPSDLYQANVDPAAGKMYLFAATLALLGMSAMLYGKK